MNLNATSLSLAALLALAPAAIASPPADPRDRLEAAGLDLGKVRLALEGRPALVERELRFTGGEAGSDETGAFTAFRYDMAPGEGPAVKGTITLKWYAEAGLLAAAMDYDGPPLAAENGLQLTMNLPGYGRGMAITRFNPYWTGPAFASDYRRLPESNALVLWQGAKQDDYRLLVPLAGDGMVGSVGKARLRFGVALSAHAAHTPRHVPLFVYARGQDPYALARRAYTLGFREAGLYGRLRWQKPYPEAYRGLGWCSWEAYHHEVDRTRLLASARSMAKKGIHLGYMLIDDGWMTVDGRRLAGFEADAGKFPGGLKPTVEALHGLGIRHVGVWHTLQGYWEGVVPAYGKQHRLFDGLEGSLPDPRGAAGSSFYDAWYRRLAADGIDFLKVDGQANNTRFTDSLVPLLDSAAGSHRALEEPAARYFEPAGSALNLLNCMALTVEHAYAWRHSNLARTSDDYQPGRALASKEHVLQNAYNSYWVSNFAYPDYDMFVSGEADAEYQAIARAVSGGPIYVSDRPGRENAPLLKRLAFTDGTLPRLDGPGRVTPDTLLVDTGLTPVALEIANTVTRPGYAAGLVAAFNVDKTASSVEGSLSAADVPQLPSEPLAVYQHGAKSAFLLASDEAHAFKLASADVFTLAPVRDGAAVFGLTDKFAGAAAVKRARRDGRTLTVSLVEGGDFAAWVATPPARVRLDGRALAPGDYAVQGHLLRVPAVSFGAKEGARTVRLEW